MGKIFSAGAAKSFVSLSVLYVFHIAQKEQNPNHEFLNDHPDNNHGENVFGHFSVFFPEKFMFAFIVIWPILELSFGFSKVSSLTRHFTFSKVYYTAHFTIYFFQVTS